MNNIERALDDFFQRLNHASGPWYLMKNDDGGNLRVCHRTDKPITQQINSLDTGKLIVQAPDMLRTLCRTYLSILVRVRYGTARVSLNDVLADLRDVISDATGWQGVDVQSFFEQYAMWIHVEDLATRKG